MAPLEVPARRTGSPRGRETRTQLLACPREWACQQPYGSGTSIGLLAPHMLHPASALRSGINPWVQGVLPAASEARSSTSCCCCCCVSQRVLEG